MAFSLKTWVNRISEYPNRRKLTHEDGSTELVTVARAEGQISAEGNAFSAEEMNDLENRIKGGFDEVNRSLTNLKTFPEDGERLIGTAGRYKVYEVSKAVQLNAGFLSFKLCEHNPIQVRSLEAFISSPDNSYIYKANIENGASVIYKNGTMNINLTSQTTANNIVVVHCIYLA